MATDLLSMILTIVNTLMIINIPSTFFYEYDPKVRYRYLKHISKLIRKSVLDYINIFYISIFFRVFKWRYVYQI